MTIAGCRPGHRLDAVKRVVERRTQQLGHPRVDDRELAVGPARFQIGDARDERAGGTGDCAAGFDDDRQVRRADFGHDRGDVLLDLRWPAIVVGDAEPAADVDILERKPLRQEPRAEFARGGGGVTQRFERGDLRPDVQGTPPAERRPLPDGLEQRGAPSSGGRTC